MTQQIHFYLFIKKKKIRNLKLSVKLKTGQNIFKIVWYNYDENLNIQSNFYVSTVIRF